MENSKACDNQHQVKITNMSKAIIADIYEFSPRRLAYYLNKRYYKDMKEVGYKKTTKILTPLQIEKIIELIGEPYWNN